MLARVSMLFASLAAARQVEVTSDGGFIIDEEEVVAEKN